MFGAKPATTPTRKIIRPKKGPDGLFIQPREFGPDREQIENKLRMAAAEHFNYADPYTGNTRTFDEEGRYNCGRCNQVHGKECILVKLPSVDLEAGSCRKWENICAGDPEAYYRYGDAEEAVYGVAANGVGFGCKRCPYGSKAYQPDSRGRNMYCGKLWFRVFGNACCALNGAKTKTLAELPGYAKGGRVSAPHALNAINRAMMHLKTGNLAAAHQELLRSPDALAHPGVQKALPLLQQAQMPQQFAEGGEVDDDQPAHLPNSSSPGSPGISGAVSDAIHALKDYFIDTPRREVQEARRQHIDRAAEGLEPGYADGGKVTLMQNMLKMLVEHAGLSQDEAAKALAHFRQQSGQVSPIARQMAEHMVQNVRPNQFHKSPAQLAKELRAGFVPPSDFNHLMYTDPALTPLLNRYQGGVDNNNLTPQQKMALIQKLESLGGATPPPAAASPQQVDAILSQPPQ